MRFFTIPGASALVALVAFASCVAPSHSAVAASAENGKTAYVKYGCWQCHDFNGQGASTSNGLVIARTALPLDAFKSFVRTTNGPMPPYRAPVLGDADLDDIYAYLQSLPQPKPAGDIPLLKATRSQ
jgi:mono/diheme cytochrome c family protein